MSSRFAIRFLLTFILQTSAHAATFTLPAKGEDVNGRATVMTAGENGAVLVFLSARCPCSNSHVELLKKLSAANPKFTFYAVHANGDEPVAEAKTYFAKKAMPFPVLQDAGLKWANALGANKTPHAFIVSPKGEVLYAGGVTDSHEAGDAHHQYLADTLKALNEGHPVPQARTRTLGCIISRASL